MRRSTAVIAALTMVLAACGDGGGDDEGTAAACDAYVAVDQAFFVDEEVEAGTVALQEFHDNAPDEVAAQVEPFLTRLREDGAAGLESEELVPAETAADDYAFENCGDTDVELSAVDYALSGAPSELDAGRIAFRLTNDTQTNEVHEALLLRKKDGVAGTPHEALSRGLGATISVDDTLPRSSRSPWSAEDSPNRPGATPKTCSSSTWSRASTSSSACSPSTRRRTSSPTSAARRSRRNAISTGGCSPRSP